MHGVVTRHNPTGLYPKYAGYCHAIELGSGSRLLFVSGLNGYLEDGKTMPESFDEQCRTIWKHLATILRSAEMDYSNLVSLRTYLADPKDRFADARLRKEHLGEHELALTVVCARLLVPDWKLEMEAVAAA
jgi:2-iminobutanoate/2-iminopropanoate deaminase